MRSRRITFWNLSLWDLRWYYERIDEDTVYLIIELPDRAETVLRALQDAHERFGGWWLADVDQDEDGTRFLRLERRRPPSAHTTIGGLWKRAVADSRPAVKPFLAQDERPVAPRADHSVVAPNSGV